ncbi:MAG: NUDIX domain-containing protein [Candidatus Absconditabacterales bacterium]|nr:NUDIX domain-containing protein [Candidatus Absconditabacterales bacterium]
MLLSFRGWLNYFYTFIHRMSRGKKRKTKPVVQSAGGVVYIMDNHQPKYLLIKRQAKSKKIERVCPKGKLEPGETPEQAALREVGEETGLSREFLVIETFAGLVQLRSTFDTYIHVEKDTKFFLMKYLGSCHDVCLINGEGYMGVYVWADFAQAINLLTYPAMRDVLRRAHQYILLQPL